MGHVSTRADIWRERSKTHHSNIIWFIGHSGWWWNENLLEVFGVRLEEDVSLRHKTNPTCLIDISQLFLPDQRENVNSSIASLLRDGLTGMIATKLVSYKSIDNAIHVSKPLARFHWSLCRSWLGGGVSNSEGGFWCSRPQSHAVIQQRLLN